MPWFGSSSKTQKANAKQAIEALIGRDTLALLEKLVKDERSKPPKVAVIGKAGVGKTTTINNIFNADWRISHTSRGTSAVQMKEFNLAGGGTLLVCDLPGLGEDLEADEVFEKAYHEVLPSVDVVLYVLQANAKDLSEDQRILADIVLPYLKTAVNRVVVGLNQVDKIGPGEWNVRFNFPSPQQQDSIERRSADIRRKLSAAIKIDDSVIMHYSALYRFRLFELLTAIISAAGELGWKFPIQPKDPFELADADVQDYVRELRSQRKVDDDAHRR